MDNFDIKVSYLASDNEYYVNVFKKTERIVSVILYVLSETASTPATAVFHETLKAKAVAALEGALTSLSLQPPAYSRGLFSVQHALVGLGSALELATAARVISTEVRTLIVAELDAVQRYLKHHYLSTPGLRLEGVAEGVVSAASTVRPRPSASAAASTSAPSRPRPSTPRAISRSQIPAGDISTDAYLVYSHLTDRSERIKTVLSAKPEATIKDIAEVITDVSEKTIQRELNSLIEKGQVIRQGERRWSKYSLAE